LETFREKVQCRADRGVGVGHRVAASRDDLGVHGDAVVAEAIGEARHLGSGISS